MSKPSITRSEVKLMDYLMEDKTIYDKIVAAGEEGKSYAIYSIRSDGKVVLGETKYRFWNQLIGCKTTLTFEAWCSAVWDALLDLSDGANQKALLHGLSKEILEEGQRNKKYGYVIERLFDCYKHVCNRREGAVDPEGSRVKSGLSGKSMMVGGDDGVVVNVNVNNKTIPLTATKLFRGEHDEVIDVEVNSDGSVDVTHRR